MKSALTTVERYLYHVNAHEVEAAGRYLASDMHSNSQVPVR